MATVNIITGKKMQTRAVLAFILSYCSRDEKTEFDGRKLVSGVNCVADSVYQEFINTKLQYGKTYGRMFYHLFQSFHPDEQLTPETAHEIALKLAEEFKDYEVLVATHTDKDHIHSHFVINSVSFENGKSFMRTRIFCKKSVSVQTNCACNMGCQSLNGRKKKAQKKCRHGSIARLKRVRAGRFSLPFRSMKL